MQQVGLERLGPGSGRVTEDGRSTAMAGGGVLTTSEPTADPEIEVAVRPVTRATRGDRIFRGLATAATSFCLLIVGLTFVFLVQESRPALESTGIWNFFTTSVWNPTLGKFGVLGLLEGTLIISCIAMVVGVPIAIAMALFINEYAPAKIRGPLTSVIDLLAALPSLLFGMWGFFALSGQLVPVAKFLTGHFSAL